MRRGCVTLWVYISRDPLHRKKKKKSKAEEVVEVVEKVIEKVEEKAKDTRTTAEKAYAAVQAKRVSFPASNTGSDSYVRLTAKAEGIGEGQKDPQTEGGGEICFSLTLC